MLYFEVPGEPVKWARAGQTFQGKDGGVHRRSYTPHEQRGFMARLSDLGAEKMAGSMPMKGPLAADVTAFYLRPASHTKKQRAIPWKITAPDGDNLYKIVADALQKIVFENDAQICDLRVRKRYGDRARLEVWIGPAGEC